MSTLHTLMATVIAGLGVALGGAASAQVTPGPYVGANINIYSKYSIDCDAGVSCDKTGRLSGKVYGGYDFGSYGLEGLAFAAGSVRGSLANSPFSNAGTLRQDGIGLVGVLPFTSGDMSFKGKLGVAYVRGRASYTGGGTSSDKTFTPIVGASVAYALTKTLSMTGDWDQTRAEYGLHSPRTTINMFSLGLSTKF